MTEGYQIKDVRTVTHKTLMRVDSGDDNITYIGKIESGSITDTDQDIWRIYKLDETTNVDLTMADGDDKFDNIWDNRESLSYS